MASAAMSSSTMLRFPLLKSSSARRVAIDLVDSVDMESLPFFSSLFRKTIFLFRVYLASRERSSAILREAITYLCDACRKRGRGRLCACLSELWHHSCHNVQLRPGDLLSFNS